MGFFFAILVLVPVFDISSNLILENFLVFLPFTKKKGVLINLHFGKVEGGIYQATDGADFYFVLRNC